MILKIWWIVFACSCLFISGCQNQQGESPQPSTNQPTNNELPEQETPSSIEEDSPQEEDLSEDKGVSYPLTTSTFQQGELTIHYPQLIDMDDENKKERINEMLKQDAIKYVSQYEDGGAALSMNYQVMMNTVDTLSILYTGTYNGGMYPTHLLFTTNINLKDGNKTKLSNVVTINEQFIDQFKQAPYIDREQSPIPNEEKKAAVGDYLNSSNAQDLLSAFKQADHPSMEENPYGVYSYFYQDSLIVSIQVPHALGDHAEFKIELE